MKRLVFLFLFLFCANAHAQSSVHQLAQAVATCGTRSLTAGVYYPVTQDLTGTLCTASGGGGGGTAVTIADGADVTQGAKADAACGSATGTCTEIALLKYLNAAVVDTTPVDVNATLSAETTKVIGTVNQGTSPWVVSGTVTANGAVTNAGTFAVQSQPTPVTSGGLSLYNVQPTASDNHVVIKNGAGQVYKISVTNNSATVNYIRLYNAGTGFNGCNSATNLVYSNAIPASATGAGILDQFDMGIAFATGISICVTSGYAQTDTTAATASAMNVNIGYK